jgi:MerR family transcriptional regulator/heat shock protein HspR
MVGHSNKNMPLYTIGVAAELAGVHPQTLRAYEQKGLITPQRTRGNTRMYSQADLERLELISELTAEGINLAGVMRIIDLQNRLDEAESNVESLHNRVQRLARRVTELSTATPPPSTGTAIVRVRDMKPELHWLADTTSSVRIYRATISPENEGAPLSFDDLEDITEEAIDWKVNRRGLRGVFNRIPHEGDNL